MRRLFSLLHRTLSVPSGDPELSHAQFRAMSKQVPLLYFILIVNCLAVSFTFSRLAPLWLSVFLPVGLSTVAGIRGLKWWLARHKEVSPAEALSSLRKTNLMAGVLAAGFTAWGLCLYHYGDATARGHVVFFMAITVIGCILCLMHLRSAAIMVTLVVNIPFVIFMAVVGGLTEKAIAVNVVLVSGAVIVILMTHYRDFTLLVRSRRDLMAKQAETQALSDENFRIANLDALTDLPNRRRFFHDMGLAFADAANGGAPLAVCAIDLDGFKPVNDTYGHATGDRVLIEAARRLRQVCVNFADARAETYRLGGDEFGVIVRGALESPVLETLGGGLTESLRVPFAVGSAHAHLACSVGIATWTPTAESADSLFDCADYALYYAKRNLRGQTVLFSEKHAADIKVQDRIEMHLHAADLCTELTLVFQPIIDLTTGLPVIAEALARWHSPQLGPVAPDVFIPAAERAGLIGGVTRVLLEKALAEVKAWPEAVGLSFNLSAHDICAAEGVVRLVAIINASGVDPRRIDFEITETAMAFDFVKARQSMLALKALGCRLSLDDFGTGYSSLSYVHRLPLDCIKVDRSFVTDIEDNSSTSGKIVRSMTTLCADMGLKSIIEGVETQEQLDRLRGIGCDMAQGYLFARPMPSADIRTFLRQGARLTSTG